jgi:phenylacetate-CoA ligase
LRTDHAARIFRLCWDMFETGIAQLRSAYSLALGKPFALWSLEWLIGALHATRREFGTLGSDAATAVTGPPLDAGTRRELQLRRFRTQAVRAADETPYYEALFRQIGLDPRRLSHAEIARIPLTPKAAAREQPDAFVCRGAKPMLRATTTGTTGNPTSICFSQHELRVYAALGAIAALNDGSIQPDDIAQISTSARGLLGNVCLAGACAHVGALVTQTGVVDPAYALAQLADVRDIPGKRPRVSLLHTYPSYLGELIESGLRLGYTPRDFGVRLLNIGGEIVTAGLRRRAARLFGETQIVEGFGMTEIWPVGGRLCEQGHLHWEPAYGLLEVVDPQTSEPAPIGEAGCLVATPFPPFRETTLLLRFNTEDMVCNLLPATPPASDPRQSESQGEAANPCSLHHLPATSNVLGKRRLAVQHRDGWVYPRQVLEALEAVDEVPLPAHFGAWPADTGVAVEVVVREVTPQAQRVIADALAAQDVPLAELSLITDRRLLRRPYPLRCDLREQMF